MPLRVIHLDSSIAVVEKPAGFHVHPPEDPSHRIPKGRNCLGILRDQLGQLVYPVHRLDGGTSGVVVFALNPETAGRLGLQFQRSEVQKIYYAVTRGWIGDEGVLEQELDGKPSKTEFRKLAQVELPQGVGPHPSARYSLVEVKPATGRNHQIRRHFARASHPLVGDSLHGDTHHNRFFRETLRIPGLFLKAHSLEFRHPVTGDSVSFRSRWSHDWHRVFELFGICPWLTPRPGFRPSARDPRS